MVFCPTGSLTLVLSLLFAYTHEAYDVFALRLIFDGHEVLTSLAEVWGIHT